MEKEIQSVLEQSEQIIWEGKQDPKATIVASILGIAFILIFGLLFFNIMSSENCKINGEPGTPEQCQSFAQKILYGVIAIAVIIPLFAYLNYKVTYYLITSKRILIKSGLIGADMRSVYYDQIKSAFVNVGIIGKIFGTGTILIDTGRMTRSSGSGSRSSGIGIRSSNTRVDYDKFSNIKNPYEVYKKLQDMLSSRKEGLYSGRSDFEGNKNKYKDYVQETERMKRSA